MVEIKFDRIDNCTGKGGNSKKFNFFTFFNEADGSAGRGIVFDGEGSYFTES